MRTNYFYSAFNYLFLMVCLTLALAAQVNAVPAKLMVQVGHTNFVRAMAFSPDGKTLASGSNDNTVKLWSSTGQLRATLTGHADDVNTVAFAPDGKTLATGSDDSTVKLWDSATGQLRTTLHGHRASVQAVAFAPDGRTLASGSWDNSVNLWDAATGQLRATLRGHKDWVGAVAFAPNSTLLASGSNDSTVKLWDTATGQLRTSLEGHTGQVTTVAFAPDGQTLASSSWDKSVKLWDITTGQLRGTFVGHTEWVKNVVFAPDGRTLASAGWDSTVRLWDIATGQLRSKLVGHKYGVYTVVFAPDGKTLASGSNDNTVKLWTTATGQLRATLAGHTDVVKNVVFAPDGKMLASASLDKTIKLWNPTNGQLHTTLRGHTSEVKSVAFAPDGKTFASGNRDYKVQLWDAATGRLADTGGGGKFGLIKVASPPIILEPPAREPKDFGVSSMFAGSRILGGKLREAPTGRLRAKLNGHTFWDYNVSFAPDGKTLASGSHDQAVKLWDVATGRLRVTLEGHRDYVYTVAFTPDGKTLASGSDDSTVKLWNPATGQLLATLSGHTRGVLAVAFAPDGKTLASGSNDDTVKLWRPETGQLRATLSGHTSQVNSVAFAPDGRTLASASDDRTIALWDPATGQFRTKLSGHTNSVTTVAFAPDALTLASASNDETVRLWDTATGQLRATLKGHTGAVNSVNFSPGGKTLISGSDDTSIRVWRALDGKPLLIFYPMSEGDYVVLDSQGRFDGTPGGLKQLHYVAQTPAQLVPVDLEQLKERFYEPDLWRKVLTGEELRGVPVSNDIDLPPTIQARLVAGTDPGSLSRVRLTLTNQAGGGLGRVQILVNGTELRGDARDGKVNLNAATATMEVDLAGAPLLPGTNNKIEVIAWNGKEYVRSRALGLNYVAPKAAAPAAPPRFFALAVGTGQYADPSLNLAFAPRDAWAMGKSLSLGGARLFGGRASVRVLSSDDDTGQIQQVAPSATFGAGLSFGGKPTRSNIMAALGQIRAEAQPQDVLVLFFSGHGTALKGSTNAKEMYAYLCADTRSADPATLQDPQVLATVAITSEDLATWLTGTRGIKALKRALILDTCAAGAAVEALSMASKDPAADTVRALDRLKDRTGFHVLMGSAADKVAYEASRYGQGFLTYALLRGMSGEKLRDGSFVDVSPWFQYARDTVPDIARGIARIQEPRIIAPLGDSFDIGQLSAAEKTQIPVSRAKPILLRPTLLNPVTLRDNLGLSALLRNSLRESLALQVRGRAAAIFVDADPEDIPGALLASGTYRQVGDNLEVEMVLTMDGLELKRMKLSGPANDKKSLVAKLAKAILGI